MGRIQQYDWSTWLVGILRSFVAGAGGAVAGIAGPSVTDPKDFNLGVGLHHTLVSMAIGAGITGMVHMGIFLSTHGAPEPLSESVAAVVSEKAIEIQHTAQIIKDITKP